jgi:hypothetical protein
MIKAAARAGAGSPRQLLALGVDLAADEARHLVPVGSDLDGPIPVGHDPAGLLTSTSLLLGRLGTRRCLTFIAASIAASRWSAMAAYR